MKPLFTVLVIVDKSGKTQLLGRFKRMLRGRLQLLSEGEQPYWDGHDIIAFDGLQRGGELTSLVEYLEHEALQRGKKLILVVRDRADIASRGIRLQSSPLLVEIDGDRPARIDFRGIGFLGSLIGNSLLQSLIRLAGRILGPTDFTGMVFRECLHRPKEPG